MSRVEKTIRKIFWGFTYFIELARCGSRADVAELADALDSKSGTRESVWVRPPPSAPPSMRGFLLHL